MKLEYVKATPKDVELLSCTKLVLIIDDEADKKLSNNDKIRIKEEIDDDVFHHYKNYELIYLDNVCIGSLLVIDYLDGKMIDHIFLFTECRNKGTGTLILQDLKDRYDCNLYVWMKKNNEAVLKFFNKNEFFAFRESGATSILKYDLVFSGLEKKLSGIRMGYRNQKGLFKIRFDDRFINEYYLQSPQELLISKYGLSFDIVELERSLIHKTKIPFRTYFIINTVDNSSHSFLVYRHNKKYYWFEYAWLKYRGIHEYLSKSELFKDVYEKFNQTFRTPTRIKIYKFVKPKYGINYFRYMADCMGEEEIKGFDKKEI